MIGYEDIMRTKMFTQIVSTTWICSACLIYIIAGPLFNKICDFMSPMVFDYSLKPLDNVGNNTMFGAWRQNDMEVPVRTYTVIDGKITVKYTVGNYPFASGGPSNAYKWIWLTEKNRMGWSSPEPDPIVTLITSDGFGAICDKICKDK